MTPPEKLSIEKSVPGRRGVRFARPAQPALAWLPASALRKTPPRLPEMSEFDVVRLEESEIELGLHKLPGRPTIMVLQPRWLD